MDEIAKRFAELAEKYGPTVVDAALSAARIEGYSTLVSSVLWLPAGLGAAWVARWLWKRDLHDDLDSGIVKFFGAAVMAGAAACIAAAIWTWIDPWTWTAINHPELWIAKRVLHL